jgi:hypothetical protein
MWRIENFNDLDPRNPDSGNDLALKFKEESIRKEISLELQLFEYAANTLALTPDLKLTITDPLLKSTNRTQEVEHYRSLPGVIETTEIANCLMVMYNSQELVPEGCRDLAQLHKSAEFDPEFNTIYIDIVSHWDYLEDRYEPDWILRYIIHEFRHFLVNIFDQKIRLSIIRDKIPNRYNSKNLTDDEIQAMYLNEIHSLFFDAAFFNTPHFVSLDETLTTLYGQGTHIELASKFYFYKEKAIDLFELLAQCLHNYRSSIGTDNEAYAKHKAYLYGTCLATASNIARAVALINDVNNTIVEMENHRHKRLKEASQPGNQYDAKIMVEIIGDPAIGGNINKLNRLINKENLTLAELQIEIELAQIFNTPYSVAIRAILEKSSDAYHSIVKLNTMFGSSTPLRAIGFRMS